jgi:hypothetical protein
MAVGGGECEPVSGAELPDLQGKYRETLDLTPSRLGEAALFGPPLWPFAAISLEKETGNSQPASREIAEDDAISIKGRKRRASRIRPCCRKRSRPI